MQIFAIQLVSKSSICLLLGFKYQICICKLKNLNCQEYQGLYHFSISDAGELWHLETVNQFPGQEIQNKNAYYTCFVQVIMIIIITKCYCHGQEVFCHNCCCCNYCCYCWFYPPSYNFIFCLLLVTWLMFYIQMLYWLFKATGWVGLWGLLWWAPSAKRKGHHGVSSGWSSVWHRSNIGLSSTQY